MKQNLERYLDNVCSERIILILSVYFITLLLLLLLSLCFRLQATANEWRQRTLSGESCHNFTCSQVWVPPLHELCGTRVSS